MVVPSALMALLLDDIVEWEGGWRSKVVVVMAAPADDQIAA